MWLRASHMGRTQKRLRRLLGGRPAQLDLALVMTLALVAQAACFAVLVGTISIERGVGVMTLVGLVFLSLVLGRILQLVA